MELDVPLMDNTHFCSMVHHLMMNQIHQAPAPLMSTTNSSRGHKDPNCRKVVDIFTPRESVDDFKLSTAIWLETTRDIAIGEKFVWDYPVH